MRELADRAGTRGSGDASYGKLKSVPTPEEAARPCGVSLRQWTLAQNKLAVAIDGAEMTLDARENSTGSLGWGHCDKVWLTVDIDGEEVKVRCHVTLAVTLIDSKPIGGAITRRGSLPAGLTTRWRAKSTSMKWRASASPTRRPTRRLPNVSAHCS